MLRTSWVDIARNEEVIEKANLEDRQLFKNIKRRKVSYRGHTVRGKRYSFQRLILEGKIQSLKGICRSLHSTIRRRESFERKLPQVTELRGIIFLNFSRVI